MIATKWTKLCYLWDRQLRHNGYRDAAHNKQKDRDLKTLMKKRYWKTKYRPRELIQFSQRDTKMVFGI